MKKFKLTLLSFSLLLGSFSSAFADGSGVTVSPYVSTKLSYGWSRGHDVRGDFFPEHKMDGIFETTFNPKTDSGVGTKLAIGISTAIPEIYGAIRTELELGFNPDYNDRNVDSNFPIPGLSTLSLDSKTFLFNLYYDLKTSSKFSPYIGAGVGLSRFTIDVDYHHYAGDFYNKGHKTGNKFVWQVGAGVAYNFVDNVALDLGYRFTDFGEILDFRTNVSNGDTPKIKGKMQSHEVLLGLRYSFN
jgi:opacity protein-like surface antigen